jgi:hypothetical protein
LKAQARPFEAGRAGRALAGFLICPGRAGPNFLNFLFDENKELDNINPSLAIKFLKFQINNLPI